MVHVQLAVSGIQKLDLSDQVLHQIQDRLSEVFGTDPAVVFWPADNELGIQFDVEEEVLGRLLESEASRLAA